jgi:hypothetical protein
MSRSSLTVLIKLSVMQKRGSISLKDGVTEATPADGTGSPEGRQIEQELSLSAVDSEERGQGAQRVTVPA